MKTIFTFLSFAKKMASFLTIALFFASSQIMAQTTATIDFESAAAGATTFSAGGISFSSSGRFIVGVSANLGANSSKNFLYTQTPVSGSSAGTINITSPSATAFKLNSFAAYASNDPLGNTNNGGTITFTATLLTGGTATATATIPSNGSGNGVVSGITLSAPSSGNSLVGAYVTSVSITMSSGMQYLELDDINFTTQAIVSNQFSINNVSITEGNSGTKAFTFTVTRTSTAAASTVQYSTADGTATAPSDYTSTSGTLSFPVGGSSTQTITVLVNGDNTIEGDETFYVNLSNPSAGSVISDAQGVGTILEDDEVTETFEDETVNAQTFSQSGFSFYSNGALMISRGNNVGNGAGVTTALDTRIGNGGSTGNVGTFGLITTGVSFNITKIDVWTSNNDGASSTSGAVTVTFIGTKADGTGTISYPASVNVSGNTFQTINFTGTTLANIPLTAITVVLGSGINYISLDNFKYGTASLSATQVSINDISVLEGTGGGTTPAVFTITRTNNSSTFSVSVTSSDGTATAGSDYTAFPTTVVNFTAGGALTQTVTVNVLRDAVAESNETFFMTLSNVTNGVVYLKQVGTATILDDDNIVETFEDETNAATTFSQNSVAFSTSGRYKVLNSAANGSGSSSYYLDPGNGSAGSMGKFTITSSNKAFKLISLDAWVGTLTTAFTTNASVTFTGTLYTGGTITATKIISASSNTGSGWQQNITFTGTSFENALVTAVEVTTVSPVTVCELDNITYAAFTTAPYLEVADASNNAIASGGTASTSNNTDFGTTCVGSSVVKTYTIKNTGATSLTFSGSPIAVVGGTDASQFAVTTQPTSPIASGGSTTVTVTYTPTTLNTHNATITLTSNDANSPFVINIKGTANATIGTWAGTANGVWTNSANWPCGFIPTSTTNVIIPSGTPNSPTLSGPSTINSLTINSGATLTLAANATLTVQSDLIATGTYTANASGATTIFSGATQLIPGTTYYNLQLNGAGSKTLASNATVNNVLTLSAGTLSLGSNNLTISNAGSISATNGSYIITNGTGGLVQQNIGTSGRTGSILFPVGSSTSSYTPVLLTNAGTADTYTIGVLNSLSSAYNTSDVPTGTTQTSNAVGRTWLVKEATAGGSNVSLTFQWNASDELTSFNRNASYVSHFFNGFWHPYATSAASGSNPYIKTITSVNTFSPFGIASSNSILPLTLISFTGKINDNSKQLNWTTSSELNMDYFSIERSENGVDFTSIANVTATGNNSAGTNAYTYNDATGTAPIYYYRLRLVDKDGTFSYSNIVAINTLVSGNNYLVKVTPNPFQSQLLINVNAPQDAQLNFELVDMSGKKLMTQIKTVNQGNNTITINQLDNITHGTYMLHFFNNSINQTIKLVKFK